MLDTIVHNGELIAMVLRANARPSDIEFYTSPDSPQQLAAMTRARGYVIAPHVHNEIERRISRTQEVIVVRQGAVRLDLYASNRDYLESRVLEDGDIAFLAAGGHGFTVLRDAILVEVKQGPYAGADDKVRFEPVGENHVVIK